MTAGAGEADRAFVNSPQPSAVRRPGRAALWSAALLLAFSAPAASAVPRVKPDRGPGKPEKTPTPTPTPTPSPTPTPTPTPTTGVAATSARAFTDSVCVATHLHYSDTAYYSRWPEVRDALVGSGIRHVRDGQLDSSVWSYPTVSARWKEWADRGVRATLGPYPGDIARKVALAAQNPAVEAIEGPNELDLTGTGWQTRLLDAQRAIWEATRAQPNLAGRPVLVGSLAFSDRWSQVTTDLKPYFTDGNLHSYPGGQTPGSNLSTQFAASRTAFGAAPVRVTETGYHNAVAAPTTEGHKPASERAGGIYVPQLYLEYFRRGVKQSCMYELLDEWADPERNDRESNFGLLRSDLSRKPAYTHLQRLLSLLGDPFPASAPSRLDYTVTGPSTLRHVLLQKGDGSFWLALWNDVSVWDPVARTDTYPADATASVSLGGSRAWSLYDVRGGTTAVRSGTGSSVSVGVPVSPLLLQVR